MDKLDCVGLQAPVANAEICGSLVYPDNSRFLATAPGLQFSILKLCQLQREFTLSLEDTKTWYRL